MRFSVRRLLDFPRKEKVTLDLDHIIVNFIRSDQSEYLLGPC